MYCPVSAFSSPWIRNSIFKVDRLQCADQSVSTVFTGSILDMLLEYLPGDKTRGRCASLWTKLQELYRRHRVEDTLQRLLPGMIRKPKRYPKPRCSAAQVRVVVPFVDEIAASLLTSEDRKEQAAKVAAAHLHQCYTALSSASVFGRRLWQELV